MKKRFLSILLSLCMVLALLPVTAFAEDNEEPTETPICTCEAACTADAMNADCPVCGAEGATIENCGKYEAPVEETKPEQTAMEKVQALIDALPDADSITEENRADVEAQLTAIDEAKSALTDEELDTLDFTRYQAAVTALNTLDGQSGAETPKTLETSTWKLEYITAVGNGVGNWLNNESWAVDADSNKMTEVSPGVWEITYNDIDAFDNYQVKFACNGAWQPYIWTSDGVLDGQDNPSNVVEEDGSRVTLRIDVNDFNFVTGTGSVKTEFIVTAPGDLPSEVSTEDGLKDALVKGGNIVLDGDITISTTLSVSGNVTLDLNGHVLSLGSGKTGSVITVSENANVTLTDSRPTATTHYFTVDTNGLWKYAGDTEPTQGDYKTVTGGVITGGTGTETVQYEIKQYIGGGVYNLGTFTMSGGTITGCGLWPDDVTTSISFGGGVHNEGSFTMTNGSITGCTAEFGGGIDNLSTFTMNGGSITYCAAFNGGGVYNNFTFTISGTAMIENCTLKDIEGEDSFGAAVFQEHGYFEGECSSENRFVTLNANGGTIQGNIYNEIGVSSEENPVITRTATGDDSGTYTTFNGEIANGIIRDEAKLTVTFDSNYTGRTATTQKVLKGQKVTKPTDPTRDGYTFGGWYEKDGEQFKNDAFNFDTAITANTTLYAKWVCAGHTGGEATCQAKAVCETCGEPYGEFGSHKYTTEDKDAEGALKTAGNCQNEAVYYKSCSVCGAVSTSDTDTFKGEKDPNNHTGTLGEWQRDKNGHRKYYSCCPTVKGAEGAHSFGADGKCECGAVQYTITFDPNGGTVDPTSATTDIEGKLTELSTPTRSGSYRFDGWFTEKNGGTAVTVDTVYEANTTVYAHWTYTGSSGHTYYTIKATAGEGGSITPSGRAAVLYGASKTFTITPNDGYAIADVKVDGKSIGAVKTYTFERVRGDHTIEAVFMKATGNPQTGVDVPFTDVSENDWFYEDVAYVYANDLMKGTSETTFSPAVTTTRGMIVTILYRLEGEPTVSDTCPFEDVKSGSYYEKAITWAAANEIVGGYGNGKFGPDDAITREQMAVILYRYTQYKGMDVSVGEDTNILSYNDAQEISEYAFSSMQWACGESILNGSDGNLMPQGNATRAQVAAILHRFCENILK